MSKRSYWYDSHPMLQEAFMAWSKFPPELQVALAKHVLDFIESGKITQKNVRANRGLLGNVLWIHFDKPTAKEASPFQRRRWYDKHESLRTVMSKLSLASEASLMVLGEKILELNKMLQLPGANCRVRTSSSDYKALLNLLFINHELLSMTCVPDIPAAR